METEEVEEKEGVREEEDGVKNEPDEDEEMEEVEDDGWYL